MRAAAIDYLVARRDPSVVTLLGTADDARRLRQELEQTDDEDRIPSLAYDLRRLTFASEDPQFGLSRRDWDAWFMGRDGQTRTDWAQEAIARATATPSPPATPAGALAVEYLARLPDPPLAMLRGATTSPSWNVRVAASSALLEWDEPAAIRLLAREFQNRYVRACLAAAQALVRVAEPFPVDCTDPASRSAAAAFYARESR